MLLRLPEGTGGKELAVRLVNLQRASPPGNIRAVLLPARATSTVTSRR